MDIVHRMSFKCPAKAPACAYPPAARSGGGLAYSLRLRPGLGQRGLKVCVRQRAIRLIRPRAKAPSALSHRAGHFCVQNRQNRPAHLLVIDWFCGPQVHEVLAERRSVIALSLHREQGGPGQHSSVQVGAGPRRAGPRTDMAQDVLKAAVEIMTVVQEQDHLVADVASTTPCR